MKFHNPAVVPIAAAAAILVASLAAPVGAVPGGPLHTMFTGKWRCELPGDATTPPTPQPALDFQIVPDSSYRMADGGEGTYLLLGDKVTMTSGPLSGTHFVADTNAMVHRIDSDGKPGKLRCVRAGAAGAPSPAEAAKP